MCIIVPSKKSLKFFWCHIHSKKIPVAWYCKLRNEYSPFLQEHYWYYLASYFILQVYQVLFLVNKRETRLFFD